MATDRQVAANRANAQLSAGPRTVQGKAVVKWNSLNHGLTASELLLPGEDAAALSELAQGLYDELQPRSQLAASLLDKFIAILWRSRRVYGAEQKIWKWQSDNILSTTNFADLDIVRYEAHLMRMLFHTLHEFQRIQLMDLGQSVPPSVSIDINVNSQEGS